VAEIRGPQTGHAVENAVALAIPNIGPVTADNDARAAGPQRFVAGEWVEMMESVELLIMFGLILIRHLKNLQRSVARGPAD
jgi:hypothetical protein